MRCSDICRKEKTKCSRALLRLTLACYDAAGFAPLKSILNYINGQFVRGKREFADLNPADGTVIAQIAEADQPMVDDAVQAARKALRGEWRRLTIP